MRSGPRGAARRAAVVGGLLAGLVSATGAPAQAADEVTIDHVESADGVVEMVVSADGVPGGAIDPEQISVSVDDQSVEAEISTISAGDVSRTTVLVVDASNSMRGAKFAAASTAVDAFLEAAPPDVEIGMVAFAGEVAEPVEPTTDRAVVRDAFAALSLQKGTSVYDGLAEAIGLLGTEGSRSLLLLSDGADTGSNNSLEDVSARAGESDVVIDIVSLANAEKAAALATLADQTEGRVIPADADALGQVFTDQAEALAQQLLVSIELPEGVAGEADLAVEVATDGTTYSDSVSYTHLTLPTKRIV